MPNVYYHHTYHVTSVLEYYIEYDVPRDMLNFVPNWTHPIPEDYVVVYQFDPKLNEARRAVVKRDDDLMLLRRSTTTGRCALVL